MGFFRQNGGSGVPGRFNAIFIFLRALAWSFSGDAIILCGKAGAAGWRAAIFADSVCAVTNKDFPILLTVFLMNRFIFFFVGRTDRFPICSSGLQIPK